MKLIKNILITLAAILFSTNLVNAAEKWDMALAYGAGNFHSATQLSLLKMLVRKVEAN